MTRLENESPQKTLKTPRVQKTPRTPRTQRTQKTAKPKPVGLGSSPIYLELVAELGDPTK